MSYPPPPPAGGYGSPPPPGYGGYGGAPVNQSNGVATGALVTGLVSALCLPILCLVAIPLGFIGLSKAKTLQGAGRGQAIGGLIAGFFGLAWCLIFVVALALGAFAADNLDEIDFNGCVSDTTASGNPCESQGDADPNPNDDGVNSDPSDGVCNIDRFFEDPDC